MKIEADDNQLDTSEELITDLVNYAPDARGWLFNFGNPDLAVGYTMIFWPRFVVIDNFVLRHGAKRENLLEWLKATNGNAVATQAVMNHIHISDLHLKSINDTQAQYLGKTLREIYQTKLRADFPDRTFVVSFTDEPGPGLDHELTFWQVDSSETA